MYDESRVRMVHQPAAFVVYGKAFPFPPRGHKDHFAGRATALKEAQQYGGQLLATMEKQKGSPLSSRETITGQLDPAPDTRTLRERVAQDAQWTHQPSFNPDANPYLARLNEVRTMLAFTPGERTRRDRRLAMLEKQSADWETKREAERTIERRNSDPDIARMREHADHAYHYARNDATATAAEVRERQRLLDMANDSSSTPGDYWAASQTADKRWYDRLDAIAASKKGEVVQAKVDHTEAREVAQQAREVDRSADEPPTIPMPQPINQQ